jgi:malonyl-CoA/methylmalonyl-CoA synthetase
MTFTDIFKIAVMRDPHAVAVDFRDGDWRVQLTYRELDDAASRMAHALAASGVAKGDRVAFFLDNSPGFVIAYLAVIRLGAAMVPINLRYRRLEIGHIVADCRPTAVLTQGAHLSILEDAGVRHGAGLQVLLAEEWRQWPVPEAPSPISPVQAGDLALILYTSGTTGRSKGAMITHNNVLATVTGLVLAWGWQASDVLHLCLPLFHTHGLIVGMHCALAAGTKLRLFPRFESKRTLRDLAAGDATLFFGVPTLYVRMVEELRSEPAIDLSHMRLFCSGSAPLAPETFEAFRTLTGHTILERYGMTETGMNLSNPYAGPRLAGTVGTPLPGVDMRIVDDAGAEVVPGAEGELLIRGSNVFSGYWQAPEKTAASFSHDAAGRQWFHTGDLARQDPATGYVTLLGRRHELIISGGFNIYPREIEELLMQYPGVADAAVVGVSHTEWGEVPVAFLVCSAEVEDGQLVAYCRQRLASFKVPRQIHRVAELPRNAMGKLQKHLLPQ